MWKNRRSQKVEKKAMLDLQASLSNEVQAREVVNKQLTEAESKLVVAEKLVLFE